MSSGTQVEYAFPFVVFFHPPFYTVSQIPHLAKIQRQDASQNWVLTATKEKQSK